MVRTGDSNVRISGGKSSGKKGGEGNGGGGNSSGAGSSGVGGTSSNNGGNPVCPRETPSWQKPITSFFQMKEPKPNKEGMGESSKMNLIEEKIEATDDGEETDVSDADVVVIEDSQEMVESGTTGGISSYIIDLSQSSSEDESTSPVEKTSQTHTDSVVMELPPKPTTPVKENGVKMNGFAEASTSETPTSETPTSETPTSETPTSETPTSEKKRKSNHVNILTPKRKKD